VPIHDFAKANQVLATLCTEQYHTCGKSFCGGCVNSFKDSGNNEKCPFCNSSDQGCKTEDEKVVEDTMKRVESNDPASIYMLAQYYHHGQLGVQQDKQKAMELWRQAADLGHAGAHYNLADLYSKGGDMKKAKFHYEGAAMAGHEEARYHLAACEYELGNNERAIKHFTIAASSGCSDAMHHLIKFFEKGVVSRESVDSTLAVYNHSSAEMRSVARDDYINLQQVLCQLQGVGAVGGRQSPTAVYKSLIELFEGMEVGGRPSQGSPEDAILNSMIKLGMGMAKTKKAQAAQRAEEALSQKEKVEQKNVVEQLEDDKKRM
jgi:tetratricopeptide (TPR) repeat protein